MVSDRMINKIVFFDTVLDVDAYLKTEDMGPECRDASVLLIAMKPSVYAYLKSKNLPACDTTPYFSNNSHEKALERSEIIMEWLRKHADFATFGFGVRMAHRDLFAFWTRCPILYCLWTIEIISNAVEMHRPKVISVFLSDPDPVASAFIEPEERQLGCLVNAVALAANIGFEDIAATGRRYRKSFFSGLKVRYGPIIRFILKFMLFRLWKNFLALSNVRGGGKSVFFTTRRYQMDRLAEEMRRDNPDRKLHFLGGPVVMYVNVPDVVTAILQRRHYKNIIAKNDSFNRLIGTIKQNRDIFSFRSVFFGDVVARKIKNNIKGFMTSLYIWTIELNEFLSVMRPSIIISNGNRCDDLIIAEICNEKRIPTLMIPHGSNVQPKNHYESIEWGENGVPHIRAPFSMMALQTPLCEGFLKVFPTKSVPVKTGPILWGGPVNNSSGEEVFMKMFGHLDRNKVKVIMHAGTPKACNALRLFVYETSDEYLRSICDLADAVEKTEGAVLVIKFRPSTDISVSDLMAAVKVSDKVKISVEEPFNAVLAMTDLLVSFSSTTIEEALQNRIPVLLYGGSGRYQHVPAYPIVRGAAIEPSAVYHAKNADMLPDAIKDILDLNIGKSRDHFHLFDPYIYNEKDKISISSLLA